ncbi:hypothetical protein [Rudanella lutea]|uniref:hypothetical protein n=1 Tax=Rudanella lutea TaxID=451374 RepID=UPI000379BF60|nr:hypothetical protein [Rudanella lutea]
MTLNTTSEVALLGAIFFLAFLLLLFYRHSSNKRLTRKEAKVPLRVNRSGLLAEQKRQVSLRKQKLANASDATTARKPKTETAALSSSDTRQYEPAEDGFGEDLGAALSLSQQVDTKPKKKSRFSSLQDAADQFKEIYNRNSQL